MQLTLTISVSSIDEAETLLRNLRHGLGSAATVTLQAPALEVAADTAPAKRRSPKAATKVAIVPPAELVDDDPLGTAVGEYAEANDGDDALDLGDDDAPAAPVKAAAPKAAPAKAAAAVTPDTIKLRVRELTEDGQLELVKQVFAKFGAKKLSDIPEGKLAAVLAALKV